MGQNRLAGERSIYLRGHAGNPVDWHPWGEEALGRARREDRPIFLSVGYASCHWCHVMEREVFEDEEVARRLNQAFIAIKIDREERPDLDAAYMEALQAMTGGGGWPMSLFLTPTLRPFFGGTYFPRDHFLVLLSRLEEVYREERPAIEAQAERLAHQLGSSLRLEPGAPLDDAELKRAAQRALASVDPRWGGSRGAIKFPTPPRWSFLLHRQRRTGDPRLEEAIRTTLDAIASGGIRDHLGGGFHRYAVEETWLVPHFEKMLYDNAQLASLYLEAGAAWGEPRYLEVARDTLEFMARELGGLEGGFFASLDADSGGEEGSYYVWSPSELEAVCGPRDGHALARILGVTEAGNFEGSNLLSRRVSIAAISSELGRPEAELERLWERHRIPLRERREQRARPTLDRKLVSSWNGLAISAFARGAWILGEPRYASIAVAAADRIWQLHRRPDGSLARASTDGVAGEEGVLGDYANLAAGLLDLHQTGQDPVHLARARALVATVRARFADERGGFHLTPEGHEAPLGRQTELFDSVRPSGNAVMLALLCRLSTLDGDPSLREEAARALAGHGVLLRRAGLEMAGWYDAAELLLGPLRTLVVAGETGSPGTRALLEVADRLAAPWVLTVAVPAAGPSPELAASIPITSGKRAGARGALAYLCQSTGEGGSCSAPTDDPAELRRLLLEGWTL
jgi:uncharacterized protein YyaL (SSP411 family)